MERAVDKTGIKIGMWIFLYSEIILFGGLFVLYAVYFHNFPGDFAVAGEELNRLFGTLNTVVLLVSSFTVAASITAVQRRRTGQAVGLLLFSLGCGLVFLINKYFEWGAKFEHGLYPNSDRLFEADPGFAIFFGLYYTITGLHGLHVIIGMVLLTVSLVMVLRGRVDHQRYALLENSGLYWHLVDLIWIYVFPLFYLVL
ncbi:cytochrome c oxidase subunit 3 family protein [Desulfofustis limnaeus]|jgi:cytochrome c oxidase subunit 3|uniref:Cytochrome oxidase subunit III n=1 Tax=Desulfofustis limnaeus TaxID=2740163 RepID=A0ABM7W7F1_9BACT|nr:cytochrome c oxidase subunit 3 family protein [Desulfofustis limnaeus]MDX9896134.1 cytochrome c oxidase subunit 3 family protein [Desulfofustis sp.]BDD86803.1 cytochrome oxidase subunit III [Desulfofustis limnaeus]